MDGLTIILVVFLFVTMVLSTKELSVRLVGGGTNNEGRVEIFYNNTWGTVCDDYWDQDDATVVCRQLGLPTDLVTAYSEAFYGSGSSAIWLDDVDCSGLENSLINCTYPEWGSHNCDHSEDAGVSCENASASSIQHQLRIVGGPNSYEGRVEVYYNNSWGTVCNDYWSINNAKVVCRQIGLPYTVAKPIGNAPFGPGSGQIWLDDVVCNGSESRLQECNHNGWGINDCGHYEDASVGCYNVSNPCDSAPCLNGGVCNNQGTSYTCACLAGYEGSNCQHNNPNNDIIIVTDLDSAKIFTGPMSTLQLVEIPLQNVQRPVAVDFDPVDQLVYWTDVTTNTINRASLDGSNQQVVISNLSDPEGLALETVNRQFFWTDTGSNKIEKANMDGSGRTPIIDQNLDEPRAIVVDVQRSRFFWTDWGTSPKIERANMDGSVRATLINSDLQYPNGLAIDFTGNLMYWCDAGMNRIEVADVNGQSRRIIATTTSVDIHPFDIGIYNNDIYWSDWGLHRLAKVNRYNPEDVTTEGQPVFNKAGGLHIFKAIGIQLAGGSNSNEGRVEVFHNNVWGTVCDDSWGTNNAIVVCRQLGLPYTAAQTLGTAAFWKGSGQIWLDEVDCSGSESSLEDCDHNGWGTHDCGHTEDAGVLCSD
ncbi:scavenger receptor cysteine-rich domain-containing group B protein-like [Amphiura filiformis]|uniref:scavenger receptor cysteine-rich domain-containing group B protein-like n=1 Tax=Amphiura filiformis TaxID=82378 RepID=UPI003B225A23